MTSRPVLLSRLGTTLAALVLLAACSSEAPTPSTPAGPATSGAATAPGAAAAAPEIPQRERRPGPVVPPTGPAPVEGEDYVRIPNGQPFNRGTDKIEVVEAFGYTCPACASFEPVVASWAATAPADVEFTPVPAPFGGFWIPYAKAFYAAEALDVLPQTHEAMFHAFHVERALNHESSDEEIAQYYARFGVDPEEFARTMSSFSVTTKLNRAKSFLQESGVDSTPTMVVNGKYRVIGGRAWDEVINTTEHLIAMERAAAGNAATAPDADPAPVGTEAEATADSES
ncbi:MAG: thiol:disulfide interchange protein DsbA/DsbL [Lysobacter spongiicola]|nr:thiol:disulfide interchange protein DsbA/DsbL [Lysobacter spongiicola]